MKAVLYGCLLLALSLVGSQPNRSDAAESTAVRKVRMAFTSLSSVMCPPWIAREAGIFNRYGLDVEVIATPPASRA
jgi:ABC-type nitrate/sulfonate/bicarbonate transport system substrate-binding protein